MPSTYQVKLDSFEGPLDLLLHLVKQYEIDIYDIPVSTITKQYMHYIHQMKQLELTVASEYLVIAATLLALKSQMLLPKQILPEDDDAYAEDPREELMERLITYRKYKQAAETFQEDGHSTFTRAPVIIDRKKQQVPLKEGSVTVYDMMSALDKMFERKKWDQPLDTTVARAEIPIEQRMDEICQLLKQKKSGVHFDDLFTVRSKSHIVTTFIALLELMKNQMIFCKQEQNFDALYVFLTETN